MVKSKKRKARPALVLEHWRTVKIDGVERRIFVAKHWRGAKAPK